MFDTKGFSEKSSISAYLASSRSLKKKKVPETPRAELVRRLDSTLQRWLRRYEKTQRPIGVNFRRIVSWVQYGERSTHLIHPYPAKLLVHIPYFFLNTNLLSKPNDLVLDPFGGSGTVALEALLSGRRVITIDQNPLAVLIAKVKTTYITPSLACEALVRIRRHFSNVRPIIPDVVNLNKWFKKRFVTDLGKLNALIEKESNKDLRDFLRLCLSVCARRVSNADPRLSVPVQLHIKKGKKHDSYNQRAKKSLEKLARTKVLPLFEQIASQNLARVAAVEQFSTLRPARVRLGDARAMTHTDLSTGLCRVLRKESVELVITSPPYIGAQKYVRASSLNLGWLSLATTDQLRPLEAKCIGREHFRKAELDKAPNSGVLNADRRLRQAFKQNATRAHIAATYLLEMRVVFQRLHKVLKNGGHLVLVIGDNTLLGSRFPTKKYLKTVLESEGFRVQLELIDGIHSRGLMTKRNKTSAIIGTERILLCRKISRDHIRRTKT